MPIPETIKKLPEQCLIFSYDAEACHPGKPRVLPGSAMSLGAVYVPWGYGHPFSGSMQNRTFFTAIKPDIPMDEDTKRFWNSHPQALEWSSGGEYHATFIFHDFAAWIIRRMKEWDLPVVLVAQPHSYDVQHIMLALSENTPRADLPVLLKMALFADCAELYATHHGLEPAAGKKEWKDLFMPKNLLHEPVFDSMVQLNALFAGLLYQRPTTAA